MSKTCRSLVTLPDELLAEVVHHCSAEDVLCLEMTCKQLSRMCNTRLVWLRLLHNLDVTCSPNLPLYQSCRDLTVNSLKTIVTDAVKCFHSWKKAGNLRVFHCLSLQVESPQNGSQIPMMARLLPGGRQLLILNSGRLELWSLKTVSCVWQAPEFHGGYQCSSFDFHMLEAGSDMYIVGDFIIPEDETTYLRVFRYRMEEGTADVVYEIGLPYTNIFRLSIQDDFCLAFLPHHFQTVIVNWRTKRGVFLTFVDSSGANINEDVRSPHIHSRYLLVTAKLRNDFSVVALPLSILDVQWSSASDYRIWNTFVYNLERGSVLTLSPVSNDGPWMLTTHLFTPTWIENAPTEIYIVGYGNLWEMPKVFLSFRVQLTSSSEGDDMPADTLRPVLKSVTRSSAHRLPWDSHCVSNSGHVVCFRRNLRCFSLFSEEEQPMAELELDMHEASQDEPVVTVEPWSGALVASTGNIVQIVHLR
ncbi:uncharacterized protein FOMMEDRAFT_139520 [Fomitiporia mediterranea MF3/22]|uniref:uncharacterized protein n=1 Tax=Fomitiporia mediterranea (strain MF3/22) TaxID=694068 RepID=UPI00044089E7|nr:uncharacterized protein FOMMEDRAFT_139520 [Fomitiporia mediterranea MF3/22]EJD04798.1 hypothetical protein FOMMEDRAFT_139520 [Fomitiporia mediterranea MF3/22]